MSTEPLISISGLEVHFGQSHILQGVDLEAYDKPEMAWARQRFARR